MKLEGDGAVRKVGAPHGIGKERLERGRVEGRREEEEAQRRVMRIMSQ